MRIDGWIVAKAVVFVYILLSPFVDHSRLTWANSVPAKIAMLACIVAASFFDLQLAILSTLAFLLLIIHLNRDAVFGARAAQREHFSSRAPLAPDTVSEFPDRCDSRQPEDRDRISRDLYDLYIDPKIKPYEEYIRKLSDPDKLGLAAESAVLS